MITDIELSRSEKTAALYLLRSVDERLLMQLFDGGERRIAANAVYKIIEHLNRQADNDE